MASSFMFRRQRETLVGWKIPTGNGGIYAMSTLKKKLPRSGLLEPEN